MAAPFDISVPGLVFSAIVAICAWSLGKWEAVRPRWNRPGALDRLSDKLRRFGLVLMWLEAVLIAIGSQLPTTLNSDRILFVTIWSVVGIVAILLVCFAMADSVVRMMAHRIRATAVNHVWESLKQSSEIPQDDLLNPDDPDA
ncbi:MAG: hypothetical protein RJA81_1122 [Planctomycetota bacterium]|jgi:hypothetical protein